MSRSPAIADPRAHLPWLSGLLSLCFPGVGQLYNRQIVRGLFYGFLAVGFWCGGFGWIVHLLAGLDGWMAGGRIREWGLAGRSVRAAARHAVESTPPESSVPDGEAAPEIQSAARAAERADAGLRRLARVGAADGYAGDDTLGLLVTLVQIAFVYVEPLSYAVLRRRQLRARGVLAGISKEP